MFSRLQTGVESREGGGGASLLITGMHRVEPDTNLAFDYYVIIDKGVGKAIQVIDRVPVEH